jgi:hypothetical protein
MQMLPNAHAGPSQVPFLGYIREPGRAHSRQWPGGRRIDAGNLAACTRHRFALNPAAQKREV